MVWDLVDGHSDLAQHTVVLLVSRRCLLEGREERIDLVKVVALEESS